MVKIKTAILIIGDIVLLYLSLVLTLIIRYSPAGFNESFAAHLQPFSAIFVIWIMIFYLADLYQIRKLKRGPQMLRDLLGATILSIVISIILFYLLTKFFELTPKTNLAIFGLIFCALDFGWRLLVVKSRYARIRILTIGDSPMIREIISYTESNPQLGYDLGHWLRNDSGGYSLGKLKEIIKDKGIDIILIPSGFVKEEMPVAKLIYRLLPLKIEILYATDFFEMIFQKIPLEELEKSWFIEKITIRRNFYDAFKRLFDVVFGAIFFIIWLPVMFITAVLIKITSPGSVIFKQERTGRNGKNFVVYKFRTMINTRGGPLWTTKNDDRITPLGKILRYSHFDEIPQLWNIVKGDISFIGPRAESAELAEKYSQLPYYEMRHVVKPGMTGWAQLNYRPSASLEEALEKLKYDIYYIKNRSLILDLMIILKTLRLFFSNPK